jgi:hypothetical protein
MKLLTKEILEAFRKQGNTSGKNTEATKVIVKYFYPVGAATWFFTDYNEEDKTFFGYANLGDDDCAELGYTSLTDLENFKGEFGLGIERDLSFEIGKYTLKEIVDKKGHNL